MKEKKYAEIYAGIKASNYKPYAGRKGHVQKKPPHGQVLLRLAVKEYQAASVAASFVDGTDISGNSNYLLRSSENLKRVEQCQN